MFPSIPRAYIIRELDRADGSSSVAIDNLLLLAPDFSSGGTDEGDSVSTTPLVNTSSHTHKSILSSLNNVTTSSLDETEEEVDLNKKNWDSFDSQSRQRILADRKREMVKKARESFMKNESK